MALVAGCGPQSVGCSWFLAFAVVVSSAVLLFVFHRKPLSVWGPVAPCGGDEVGLRAVHALAEWPFVSQRVQLAVHTAASCAQLAKRAMGRCFLCTPLRSSPHPASSEGSSHSNGPHAPHIPSLFFVFRFSIRSSLIRFSTVSLVGKA